MENYFVGETVLIEATIKNRTPFSDTEPLTNPASGVNITIVDPAGTVLVTSAAMTNNATGQYFYRYIAPSTTGVYEAKFVADDTTWDGILEDQYFRVKE